MRVDWGCYHLGFFQVKKLLNPLLSTPSFGVVFPVPCTLVTTPFAFPDREDIHCMLLANFTFLSLLAEIFLINFNLLKLEYKP